MTTQDAQGVALEAICKRVFLAAHGDGWRGNQLRRDVQHVDAEKSWEAYVGHGALEKALAANPVAPPERGGRSGLVTARGIVEANLEQAQETGDADWIGLSREALEALDAALAQSPQPASAEGMESFHIVLPSGEGVAEVRAQEDGRFAVWIVGTHLFDGGYRSAWNLPSFETACRNILDVVWVGCLPAHIASPSTDKGGEDGR